MGNHAPMLEDVYTGTASGEAYFRVSSAGTLFYVTGRNAHSLVRVNRAGHTTPLTTRRAGYRLPRLSRDGKFVAVTIDPPDETQSDVWILYLQRGTFSRLTREGHNLASVITPDGTRIAWSRGGNVYWQAADGSGKPEPLQATSDAERPRDFSADGKTLIYTRFPVDKPWQIWVAPVDGGGQPSPFFQSSFSERVAGRPVAGVLVRRVRPRRGLRPTFPAS
jgi:Tol biopolymer transport system component